MTLDPAAAPPHDPGIVMALRLPIGISDFRLLRESGAYYVDKTGWIAEVMATPAAALLLPRPRRFGKTLNLSTLRCFLERGGPAISERGPLFDGLAVWRAPEARRHFARYPVIALTFKDVKAASWPQALAGIRQVVAGALRDHRYLLDDGALPADEADAFAAILRGTAAEVAYEAALRDLSRQLARHHGERVVILIDEYDIPIHSGFAAGYYDEVTLFFRNFLSGGLKDNPHLAKAVLTGVLRVARESIFSGLNNVAVHGVLSSRFADAFGFTEPEVAELAAALGRPELAAELRRWYDGYRFGGATIYNPWSVVNFATQPDAGFRPYWVFTSADDALRGLVLDRGHAILAEVEALLAGGSVTREVDDQLALRDITVTPRAVWSLLLATGYLTARDVRLEDGRQFADLVLPNAELRYVWETSIRTWVEAALAHTGPAQQLWRAMLAGDVDRFGELLAELVLRTFSAHGLGPEPERVYQAFVLSLLVDLEGRWEVRSERESGLGRCDLAVIPRRPGEPGAVLELKRLRQRGGEGVETVEAALAAAREQTAGRRYLDALRAAGAAPIHAYAVVFDGKRVWVRKGEASE